MTIAEYNALTGITIEREMTPEEIAQMEAMQQVEPTPQDPTLEERVAELQQVIVELTTVLNDKGIAP